MARQYRVKETFVTAGAYNSTAPRRISHTQVQTFDILAEDDNIQIYPEDLTEDEIYHIDELPVVNRSMFKWYDVLNGEWLVCPWLICTNKRVQRDRENGLLFRVTCDFNTGQRLSLQEDDLKLISIPNTWEQYPYLVEDIWDEKEEIIYSDANYITAEKDPLRLPTGNLYSEPFKGRRPIRHIRQSQFEKVLEPMEIIIEERLFTVNNIQFQGEGADPPMWIITQIDYQPVDLLQPGGGPDNPPAIEPNMFLMTYMLERATSKDTGGWYDRRALIDTHYLDELTGRKTAYRDPVDGSTIIPCLIKADGTLKADQEGEPDFIDYVVQPFGLWSYLRQD